MGYIANHYDNKYACDGEDHDDNGKDKSKSVGRLWLRGGMRSKSKNIATGETLQAITPFHFFDNFTFISR